MASEFVPPELEEIAAAVRREMRAEAEEAEREAAAEAAMRRQMSDVFRELMARGDRVVVDLGRWCFTGRVRHVGEDFVSVDVAGDRVDINLGLPLVVTVLDRARSGGAKPSPEEAPTLRARLLELQLLGPGVTIGVAGVEDALEGRLAAVGSDHAALGGRAEAPHAFVPLGALAFVRTGVRSR